MESTEFVQCTSICAVYNSLFVQCTTVYLCSAQQSIHKHNSGITRKLYTT
jgi:hypothetical protein